MTTPQQPGADPQFDAEIEDLPVPADSGEQVAGGALEANLNIKGVPSVPPPKGTTQG
jgi:hypothetical protein